MVCLLSEETSGESWFVCRRDEDATFRMFGLGAVMDADAGSAWDLPKNRKEPFEFRTHRHPYSIDQRRNEEIGILKGVADRSQYFLKAALCHQE